jgi:hypothetical protein
VNHMVPWDLVEKTGMCLHVRGGPCLALSRRDLV